MAKKRKAYKKRKPHKKHKPHNRAKGSYNTSGFARYRAITSAIRSNFKDQGKEYTRGDIKDLYNQFRDKLKDVPLDQIENAVDGLMGGLGPRGPLPDDLHVFPWFDFHTYLNNYPDYFKTLDEMVFNLDNIQLEDMEFYYKDAENAYHEWYPKIREKIPSKQSPVPSFIFIDNKDNVFRWKLVSSLTDINAPHPPVKPPVEPGLEVEKEKTKQKQLEAEIATASAQKAKAETINNALNMLANKTISQDQFNQILKTLG